MFGFDQRVGVAYLNRADIVLNSCLFRPRFSMGESGVEIIAEREGGEKEGRRRGKEGGKEKEKARKTFLASNGY